MATLADRLGSLIARDFRGNVNQAAAAWGVPQPTLHRYVNAVTEAPKALTLQKVARFYDTSVEWLLDGVGRSPLEGDYPTPEFRAWEKLVKTLDLPESIERLMLPLPGRISSAHVVLCTWGMFNWKGKRVPEKRAEAARLALYRAGAMESEAWAEWLRGLITSYGKRAVAEKLVSEADRLRIGFQPFAMFLQMTDRLPAELAAIYEKEFHPPGTQRGTELLNEPPIPPLNAAREIEPTGR